MKQNEQYTYQLLLTEKQAKTIAHACEVYARIRMGQFNEIIHSCLDIKLNTDDYCNRRDDAEQALLVARRFIYPELHGLGHSYGMGKFEDADLSFDVYQVIRTKFGDPRGIFSYHQLPEFRKIERDDTKAEVKEP